MYTHRLQMAAMVLVVTASPGCADAAARAPSARQLYEYEDTRALVALVNDAARQVQAKGDAAFAEFRRPGSRWRQKNTYIFVLDPAGNMLVHPDPALEGKNTLELKDINGRPIIRGLIDAATSVPNKPEGWYHYEWPEPGELLPRWKSSYVRLVTAPDGRKLIVGGGLYNDRMERAFVVDLVKDAVSQVEERGRAAFPLFRDRTGRFIAKDAYIFVIDPSGVDLVNPAFPNLEGRNILDVEDTAGHKPIQQMLEVARTKGDGWVDYLWPKPGESVSTRKSAYVSRAKLGDGWVLVGCGVYLADAPKTGPKRNQLTAPQLESLVHEAAAVFAKEGEKAYPEFAKRGSKWFRDDTYFFVWDMDGVRTFHAADPSLVGKSGAAATDVLGRPYGRAFLEVARSASGEGWVHYMYPEPGGIFPAWKSAFLERVTFPSGAQRLVGCGVYNMQMDRAFIEDVVDKAAALIAREGKDAFDELRDPKGPFVFMDTYVFVDSADGIEWVNPAQPSLEGRRILDLRDAKGNLIVRRYIEAALKRGSAWVAYPWYKPGENEVALKHTYVRKVSSKDGTFIVGSGYYPQR